MNGTEDISEKLKAHGLGAMLLMYDENVRYVTSTLTPGWNRLKPGLRYVVLIDGQKPRQSAEPDSEAAA